MGFDVPLFGWTPAAVDHTPRFPVEMPPPPEPSKRAAILTDAERRVRPTRRSADGSADARADEGDDADDECVQGILGKTVEEALKAARDEFGAELNDLDFEILTPGSRGVLGMGAEPARIVAAPRSARWCRAEA